MPKEYIERDALIAEYDRVHVGAPGGARKLMEDAPAADVVEVVRCDKCKHLSAHNSPTLYAYCEKTHFRFEPFQTDTRTHYCGFGERKDGAE